uniref:probable calcium-binding protein CML44 n=1 Tax=Erigeron canadensis TaxID=72917 RepID=UPI001CB937B6|nr:probable calcium-binding protein CML44 [Erigeron canadensis]
MTTFSANDIRLMFNKLDRNGDDTVSIDELQWLLGSMKLGSSPKELECVAGKKNLNFDEFKNLFDSICLQEAHDSENDLLKSFEVFDKNRDGFISCDELCNALSILGLIDERDGIDVNMIIKAYDLNSDGLLDLDEFKRMML